MGMKALSTLFSPSANAGKRWRIPRTTRPAVLAAFSMGLLLTGWTAEAQDPCLINITPTSAASLGDVNGRGHEKEHVWLRILAFTDAPVVGADVSVSEQGSEGRPVDFEGATNDLGAFPAYVKSHGRYRVTISGGTINGRPFSGQMSADVVLVNPAYQIVAVNPVTTLVSRILDERDLSLDRAEALVRRFLGLPVNYSLGLALRQSPHYASRFFSPVLFMTEAQAAGGLDVFEDLLLQDLRYSSSPRHLFRNPKALGDPETDFATSLASAVLSPLGNQLAGWVMAQTGLATPGATPEGIQALQQSLVDLQSSVEALTTEVAQLTTLVQSTATKTEYDAITETAQTLGTQVCDEQSRLMYFAQECPPLPDGATRIPPKRFCVEESALIVLALSSDPIYSSYANLEGFVQDKGTLGLEGMLHLYSLWLAQSKQFFRPADSTKMQNLYDYWNEVLTQAANLKVELLHQEGEQNVGGLQLIAFLGNPTLTPPTTGIFQANQATNLSLMWPPVPLDPATQLPLVVVSTQDPNHSMWSLFPLVSPSNDVFEIAPQCYLWAASPNNPPLPTYSGFGGWMLAGQPGWQAAVSLAPSGTQWWNWLIQQSQTTDDEFPASPGFWDWTHKCSGQGSPIVGGVWTQTFYGDIGGVGSWYVVDPINSRIVTNNGSLSYHLFEWALRHPVAGEQYFWYQ